MIDIENSKFEIKPKDAQRLSRLERETAFAKILETKVDLNFKLAKVLSNAQNWKIDFNGFKQKRYTLMIPMARNQQVTVP